MQMERKTQIGICVGKMLPLKNWYQMEVCDVAGRTAQGARYADFTNR